MLASSPQLPSCTLSYIVANRYVSRNLTVVCVGVQKLVADGMPTMVLAFVAICSVFAARHNENGARDVCQFVASVAAVGMAVTGVMWCHRT